MPTSVVRAALRAGLVVVLAAAPAVAAEPVDDPGDIVVEGVVPAPREAVYDLLADVSRVSRVAPERCMRKWELGGITAGKGATFEVVYLFEGFRRKLDATVSAAERPGRIDWDHAGNRGWITRFTLKPADAGTAVTVHTFVSPPPRPFRRYYANTVRPAWESCYTRLLENVGAALAEEGVRPPTPDVPEPPAPPEPPDASGPM